MRTLRGLIAAAALLGAGTCGPAAPGDRSVDFVIDVSGERFVLRSTDADTIRLAEDNRLGRNGRFPLGPLRAGNGGFNAPWTWHLDPDETRFVELAIELCDGRPSYVESHQDDYDSYCPWGARVIDRRSP